MTKEIASISYLKKVTIDNKTTYERYRAKSVRGKFFLEIECIRGANGRVQRYLNAYDFVVDNRVSEGDPVLTFKNGNKMRVYQGGDRTFMLTEARSLIELHDSNFPQNKTTRAHGNDSCDYLDYGNLNYPWPGCP